MRNMIRTASLTILAFLMCGSSVQAQPRPSASSPAYSPYLNLLRTGGSTANNYFGLVRPQIDAQNSIYGLQQQFGTLNQAVNGPPIDQQTALPTTGHAAVFMNLSRFYPGMGGAGRTGLGTRPTMAGARPATTATPTR